MAIINKLKHRMAIYLCYTHLKKGAIFGDSSRPAARQQCHDGIPCVTSSHQFLRDRQKAGNHEEGGGSPAGLTPIVPVLRESLAGSGGSLTGPGQTRAPARRSP